MVHVHRFVVGVLTLAVAGGFAWLLVWLLANYPLTFLIALIGLIAYSIGQALIGDNRGSLVGRNRAPADLPPPPPPERD